jgi:hypothetical protein
VPSVPVASFSSSPVTPVSHRCEPASASRPVSTTWIDTPEPAAGPRLGSGAASAGTASGSVAGHRCTGETDSTWLGVAAPVPIRLSIAASASVTVAIRAPASE